MITNEYTFEQHTLVGLSHGALTAAWVSTPWVDMRFIDELDYLFMKELGTAGRDPHVRFRARPKNSATAADYKVVRPHYLVAKQADTLAAIKGTGFTDRLSQLSSTAATIHEWTDATTAEDALMLVAGIFPEDLVRAGGKNLVEVRMEVRATANDANQLYMATALARLHDAEPIFGPLSVQRIK